MKVGTLPKELFFREPKALCDFLVKFSLSDVIKLDSSFPQIARNNLEPF